MADLYQNRCKDCGQFWLSDFEESECMNCKSADIEWERIEGTSIGFPVNID